jgi:hypothetical protein
VCLPMKPAVERSQGYLSFYRRMAKALHTGGMAHQSTVEKHYNTYITSSLILFLAGIRVSILQDEMFRL